MENLVLITLPKYLNKKMFSLWMTSRVQWVRVNNIENSNNKSITITRCDRINYLTYNH